MNAFFMPNDMPKITSYLCHLILIKIVLIDAHLVNLQKTRPIQTGFKIAIGSGLLPHSKYKLKAFCYRN